MAKQTSNSKQRTQNAQNGEKAGAKMAGQNGGNRPSGQQNVGAKAAPQNNSNRPGVQAQGKRPASRAAQRSAKLQQREQELQSARRSRRVTLFSILAALVVGIALIAGVVLYETSHSQAQAVNPAYPAVDGISCDTLEQTVYHIHSHLSIYVNGSLSKVPQNVGIASDGSCYYWLHTHDSTGVLHIESPTQKDYQLGNFFDEWEQRFQSLGYPAELDSTSGWQVWVNGKPYTGDFRKITLTAHELITMAYNSPGVKPDTSYSWNGL